jgi:Phage stabilisation protein
MSVQKQSVQIPILNGVFADTSPDYRIQYPVNMIPVVKKTGISKGYLRPSEGIDLFVDTVFGVDRGAIFWEGILYRVQGGKFVSIDSLGVVTEIGDVGNSGNFQCRLDYSFFYLGILSDLKFYLYDGVVLQQVTDPNIGLPIDFVFIDGYFALTDGEFIYLTDILDPFTILPDAYGSSEVDPDPILSLQNLSNELYALNRYTIEVFYNSGQGNFPFNRINGAQIHRGTIGTDANCVFKEGVQEYLAFMGGGKNEDMGIYLCLKGGSGKKISTSEIDIVINSFSETELSNSLLESRTTRDHNFLYVHLPDRTLVYDGMASKYAESPIWFILSSSIVPSQSYSKYRARNFVIAYGETTCGDPTTSNVGKLNYNMSNQYGDKIGWTFQTPIVYNETRGAIFHEIELEALTGSTELGLNPVIFTDSSQDGIMWSNPRSINAGTKGQRDKRLTWFKQGRMRKKRIQRFYGSSDAHLSISRLQSIIEGLNH